MRARYLLAALAAIGSLTEVPGARAGLYEFSYDANVGVVSGLLIGSLQGDKNTVNVSAVIGPQFDGAPAPALPVITTLATFFGRPGPTTPEVTFNGADNNILACVTSSCSDGFFLDSAGVNEGVPEFGAGPSYGAGAETIEPYDPSKWTLTAVPEKRYQFSYTASFGVVSGTLFGALEPDSNTIIVSEIVNPEFDGAPAPGLPVLTTLAVFFDRPGPDIPEVSLNGLNNNILACVTSACVDGFFLDAAGVNDGSPEFGAGPSYGGGVEIIEPYDPSKWTIVVVPEPSTWAMMLVGMGGLALAMRSRRRRPAPMAA